MSLDLAAIDEALASVVFKICTDGELPIADESIYVGDADDPRAPRPSCRLYRGTIVGMGSGGGSAIGVAQAQEWELPLLAVAEGDYTATVVGEAYTYPAGPADQAAAILAGLAGALAVCPDATAEVLDDVSGLRVIAVEAGKHLAIDTTSNLGRKVTKDRKVVRSSQTGEMTVTFQFASLLDSSSPSGSQHALAYASLLRSALWHPSSQAALFSVGVAPLRVVLGPTPSDTRIDTVTETRANLDIVFSVGLGATSRPALIETAEHQGALS